MTFPGRFQTSQLSRHSLKIVFYGKGKAGTADRNVEVLELSSFTAYNLKRA